MELGTVSINKVEWSGNYNKNVVTLLQNEHCLYPTAMCNASTQRQLKTKETFLFWFHSVFVCTVNGTIPLLSSLNANLIKYWNVLYLVGAVTMPQLYRTDTEFPLHIFDNVFSFIVKHSWHKPILTFKYIFPYFMMAKTNRAKFKNWNIVALTSFTISHTYWRQGEALPKNPHTQYMWTVNMDMQKRMQSVGK